METLVARVNAQLTGAENTDEKRNVILWFVLDFYSIHPFADGNGRVGAILCDVLLIKEKLPPAQLGALKNMDKDGLCRACGLSERERDIAHLREFVCRNQMLQEDFCPAAR